MAGRMTGRRVLVTQAGDYMGPACVDLFRKEGAEVIADTGSLATMEQCNRIVEAAGAIDVLIVNLASPNHYGTLVTDLGEEAWQEVFNLLVHPLHRLVKSTLPRMIESRKGKIVVFGRCASSVLRSTKRVCGSGPSLSSTRSSTPSTMANARSTSPPKSA